MARIRSRKALQIGGCAGLVGGAGITTLAFSLDGPLEWDRHGGYIILIGAATGLAGVAAAWAGIKASEGSTASRWFRSGLAGAGSGAATGGLVGFALGFAAAAILCPRDGQAIMLPILVALFSAPLGGIFGFPIGALSPSIDAGAEEG